MDRLSNTLIGKRVVWVANSIGSCLLIDLEGGAGLLIEWCDWTAAHDHNGFVFEDSERISGDYWIGKMLTGAHLCAMRVDETAVTLSFSTAVTMRMTPSDCYDPRSPMLMLHTADHFYTDIIRPRTPLLLDWSYHPPEPDEEAKRLQARRRARERRAKRLEVERARIREEYAGEPWRWRKRYPGPRDPKPPRLVHLAHDARR